MTVEEMIHIKDIYGLTVQQIAAQSGIPEGTLGKIFAGFTMRPRQSTMQALERTLTDAAFLSRGKTRAYEQRRDPSGLTSVRVSLTSEDLDFLKDYKQTGVQGVGEPAVTYGTGAAGTAPVSAAENIFSGGGHTVQEYFALPDEQRVELIDGVFYEMASPSFIHQILVKDFTYQMESFIRKNKGPCKVCPSPIDVQLDNDEYTILQPDIIVLCDKDKVHRHVHGAPDLVIEIESPSTRKRDRSLKHYKYAHAGVREYWIVDPVQKKVVVYDFEHNDDIRIYGFNDQIPVAIWDGKCIIDMSEIAEELADLENNDVEE